MLQKEFEALTGKKVTAEEYADIEKVYMAIDNMDKEEFCAAWNEQKFGYIVGELVKSVQELTKWRDHWKKKLDEAEERARGAAFVLLKGANEHNDEDMKDEAIYLVGMKEAVSIDLKEEFKLSEAERDYLLEYLQ
ncbi:hypothetical protein [Prevotella merdae]|uniref:hypothetical protein n=1 Tax=Prevotella merdae TaxID=2079531 RepID=UPI0035648DCD